MRINIDRIDAARHLLPPPGAEVAGQLIAEIRRLREAIRRLADHDATLTDEERDAVEVAVESYEEWLSDCGMEAMRESKQRVATLRKMLERLGGND